MNLLFFDPVEMGADLTARALFRVAPAPCRLSRGHPALAGAGGTPPRQPPRRRRYGSLAASRALFGEPKFLVFRTLTQARGISMLPLQSASSPQARPRGKLKCSRIRPLRSPSSWDVGGTETARPSILLFRSFTTNSGESPSTTFAMSGPDILYKARPWYTRLMFE